MMALDADLLDKARSAKTRLTAAERDVEIAKADYHHAVRRLHLAGAALREVAQALDLSHQRVQQIVQASGGSWWSRVWRGRRVHADMICSFCGQPPSQVAKLIAGPAVYICDACVDAATAVVHGRSPQPLTGSTTVIETATGRQACSFCGKRPGKGAAHAGSRDARICAACLVLCRRILDDRTPSAPGPASTG